jgi:hypothetical protein
MRDIRRSSDLARVTVALQLNREYLKASREFGQETAKQLSIVPIAPWSSTSGTPWPWRS